MISWWRKRKQRKSFERLLSEVLCDMRVVREGHKAFRKSISRERNRVQDKFWSSLFSKEHTELDLEKELDAINLRAEKVEANYIRDYEMLVDRLLYVNREHP